MLENTYGICLPSPSEGEDPNRYPCAHELLEAYGCKLKRSYFRIIIISLGLCTLDMRGYMTAHGTPDCSRSARYILKDYVNVSVIDIVVCMYVCMYVCMCVHVMCFYVMQSWH